MLKGRNMKKRIRDYMQRNRIVLIVIILIVLVSGWELLDYFYYYMLDKVMD